MEKKTDMSKIARALLSIFFALMLWGAASSEESAVLTLSYKNIPVEFINLNEELALDDIDTQINITLTGTNLQLNQVKKSNIRAVVDLSEIKSSGSYTMEVFIYGLPDNVTISEISNKYILVDIYDIISQSFNVSLNMTGSLPNGYILMDTSIGFDSVIVTGSEPKIMSIKTVLCNLNLSNITTDFSVSSELVAIDSLGNVIEGLTFMEPSVMIDGVVGITKEIEILPVYIGSLENGYGITECLISPSKIIVGGYPSVINNLQYINTEAIDIDGKSSSFQVMVKLDLPDNIVQISSDSITANVNISKYSYNTISVSKLQIYNQPQNYDIKISSFDSVLIKISSFIGIYLMGDNIHSRRLGLLL